VFAFWDGRSFLLCGLDTSDDVSSMVANRIPASNRLQPVTATTFVGQNSEAQFLMLVSCNDSSHQVE
jgi:hypothetical protein